MSNKDWTTNNFFRILTDSFFFLRLRFLGNAPFERSWPVTVCDPGNLQIDFFKSQAGQERKRCLCTLHIIPRSPRSPVQVFDSTYLISNKFNKRAKLCTNNVFLVSQEA